MCTYHGVDGEAKKNLSSSPIAFSTYDFTIVAQTAAAREALAMAISCASVALLLLLLLLLPWPPAPPSSSPSSSLRRNLNQILATNAAAFQYPACGSDGDGGATSASAYAFCNRALPASARASDLVARLSLEEKVAQLISSSPGVPRLGIPPYQWWNEGLHGVSNTGPGVSFSSADGSKSRIPAAVSFPQVILSAASFNTSLWKAIGQVCLSRFVPRRYPSVRQPPAKTTEKFCSFAIMYNGDEDIEESKRLYWQNGE
jgi:hypothetical protein